MSNKTNKNEDMSRPLPVGQSYQPFTPTVAIDKIAHYLEMFREPGYNYKGVITNYRHIPLNVSNHLKQGYEVVSSTHQFTDDRMFSPDAEKKDASVPVPVTKTTADGYQYLLMRISEEKLQSIKESQAAKERAKYVQENKIVGAKAIGDIATLDGGFIPDLN